MSARVFLAIAAVICIFEAQAEVRPNYPIEPAFAADQERITPLVLQYEALQLKAAVDWHEALDKKASMEFQNYVFAREFERHSKLVGNNIVSLEKYVIAKYKYHSSIREVLRFERVARQAAAEMEFFKLMLISEGNPNGKDLRREILEARMQSLSLRIEALYAALASAEEMLAMTTAKLKNGEKFSDTFGDVEIDARRLAVHEASNQKSAIETQMRVANDILAATERAAKHPTVDYSSPVISTR